MSEIAVAEEAAKVGWGIIKPIAGFLIAGSIGFAAAETYEHKAPWGLSHKLTAAIVQQTNRYNNGVHDGIVAQIAADKAVFALWAKRVDQDDRIAADARSAAADALARADANTSKQASAAYNLGRATCGASHVPSQPSRPGPDHPAASVLYGGQSGDFSDLVAAGAYTPAR